MSGKYFGDKTKNRAISLIEALIDCANAERKVPKDLRKVYWEENKLIVKSYGLHPLELLLKEENIDQKQISELLYRLEDTVKILEFNDGFQRNKQGCKLWSFSIKLWSQNKEVNILKIKKWEKAKNIDNKRENVDINFSESNFTAFSHLEEKIEVGLSGNSNILKIDSTYQAKDHAIEHKEFSDKYTETAYRKSDDSPSRPDIPGSPLAINSQFYIDSHIKRQWLEETLEPGSLIRIRAPQKMGKTSLVYRMLSYAKDNGLMTVYLSFKILSEENIKSIGSFFEWFCISISNKLGSSFSKKDASTYTKQDCTHYFQQYIICRIEAPLLLVIDDIDFLFEYPKVAKDFFSLLRGWHEMSKNPGMEIWENLHIIIAHSTENYMKLETNQSPFSNVGFSIKLPKLTEYQVQDLAYRYGFSWNVQREIKELMALVGGHPYLIQLALHHLLQNPKMSLPELLEMAPTLEGIYKNYLQRLWEEVQDPPILEALKQVLSSNDGVKLEQTSGFKLEGMGLIRFYRNQAHISCDLYKHYFHTWIPAVDLTN